MAVLVAMAVRIGQDLRMTLVDDPEHSLVDRIALLDDEARADYVASLSEEDLDLLASDDWSVVGRPAQFLPDGKWAVWSILAGRGWGKTRTGAEATKERITALAPQVDTGRPGDGVRWALTSPRQSEVLLTQLEGESGLQRIIPPSWLVDGSWERSINRSDLILKLMVNGTYPAQVEGYSARVLDSPRGHQWHGGWADEPGTYPDAHNGLDGNEKGESFMGNLLLGMRLEPFGGLIVTGTPKNNKLIRQLRSLPNTVETRGRTRDNLHNLAELFRSTVVARYAGTRLGRQELDAEILEGVGDYFQRGWFRVLERGELPWPEGTRTKQVRYWDLASGEESDSNPNPDWTVGTRIVMDPDRRIYLVEDVARFRLVPGARENRIAGVARVDLERYGLGVQRIETEPGNAGKTQLFSIGRELEAVGSMAKPYPESGSITGKKEVRAELPAAAAQQGRIFMRAADWNDDLLDEAEEFPYGDHDDIIDTLSGALACLKGGDQSALLAAPATQRLPAPGRQRQSASRTGTLPRPGERQKQRAF